MKAACVLGLFFLAACTVAADHEGTADPVYEFNPVASAAIQDYLEGRAKAPACMAVHADAAPGHFWEITATLRRDNDESTSISRVQCVARDGDRVWVEQTTGRGYVLALLVDLSRPPEANVVGAWVGRPGDPGMPVNVATPRAFMERPGESTPFTLTLAGVEWRGRTTHTRSVALETKSWTADSAWFGGVIRHWSRAAGSELTAELTRQGTTASPLLRWSR